MQPIGCSGPSPNTPRAASTRERGSVENCTPRIDEISARGYRFDDFFVTNALCSPSRASILTAPTVT